ERCQECGECLLEYTGGICPLTSCTKGLLNGPCGGARDGKCEVDRERDCGWEKIYLRLKKLGRLDLLKQFIAPKDYSKMVAAGRLEKSPIWSVEYTFKEGR
ncbi:MAG: methylenetetrahydrofolate reductase C-terminal domain-containing protein, partial [Clostridia bacterium]|nr:methylenetetrahydrofolate reductase C-terminal domain-containing protein [Clostridia bacterium]